MGQESLSSLALMAIHYQVKTVLDVVNLFATKHPRRLKLWDYSEGLAHRLALSVEHRTAVREVAGSNLDRTNTPAAFVMTSANG